ncbi:MAG: TolC family protein [Bacteroidota bacterium]
MIQKVKKSIFVLMLLSPFCMNAQSKDTLSLQYFYQHAQANYPITRQKDLMTQATDIKIKNLTKAYFPQVYLNGQAGYQSDVTSVQIPMIKLPGLDKDSYKATLDVSQTLWDGGASSAQKHLEQAGLQVDQQGVEVEIIRLKERINQLFFSVLLFQENERLLLNAQEQIRAQLKKVEAGVEGDILLSSNADVLKAELLKSDQQMIEIRMGKNTALEMLGELSGISIPAGSACGIPDLAVNTGTEENNRPEMKLYDLQMVKLDASKKIADTRLMPKISAYGQLGYGRPGLNMLSNEFNDWYMFGAKVSWNVWNWNLSKNEKKIADLQKEIVTTQKETFIKNVNVNARKDIGDIEKYSQLIEKDLEITALRKKITQTSSAQLENGVITATEYITELNNELQAALNLELHKIQKQMAKISFLSDTGKL